MSNALRRRLAALAEVRTDRGATEHEQAAARAAIGRIQARLGEPAEAEPQQAPPGRRKRSRRAREPLRKECIRVGDVLDCCDPEGVFSRCKCGSDRFAVEEGMSIATAMLVCVQCRRSRMLHPWHFRPGGRWRQS